MAASGGTRSELDQIAKNDNPINCDVLIIGAGIVGAAAFRELCRYKLNVLLVDANHDVGGDASKANSAILHGGFDPNPGTLMSKLNHDGLALWFAWSQELSVDVEWTGSLVLAFNESEINEITRLYENGKSVKIPVKFLGRDETLKREPVVNPEVKASLYAPVSGIIDPFQAVVALVGNGLKNGGRIRLDTRVEEISKRSDGIYVRTSSGLIRTKVVINAAGLYADQIMRMAGENWFSIHPRRGQYMILDKNVGNLVRHVIFRAPTSIGKGILVSRTTHGNLLIGPTAEDLDKPDKRTTAEGLATVLESAKALVPFPYERFTIAQYAGLRAIGSIDDFVVAHSRTMEGLINAAGIKSPGLTAAPGIAKELCNLVSALVPLEEKANFDPYFELPPILRELPYKYREELIKGNAAFGHMVCRCELVSEGEIENALKMEPPARDLDGIKRRVRATAGRCQGGFCMPRIIDIMRKELNLPYENITKFGNKSNVIYGDNRGNE
ncbi:NAD(P)/FAD-dependent oxidoreductase [Coprothermobacter platensis]|uniref:NAD(P)/FAD-dependent oxidoreductase n=1 Tax=Coprothermobacter platensis TaxID=108819 RepID=UPI00036ECE67|nr:NAD(P)/FAD-dependent oxidoreductase [Coprothermobacter platensis]